MTKCNNRMIIFASILGTILATGLLALNPSTIIINAGAQMYEDQYDYRDHYNNDYYPNDYQYGYEDNRRNYYNEDYNDNDYYVYDDDDDEYSDIQLEFGDKYGNYNNKDYSKHPTKDHKFVCKTGQFKGFYVKSPDVCNLEIPEGPEGPRGPAGHSGITTLDATNVYLVQDQDMSDDQFLDGLAICDADDFVLNGGYSLSGGLSGDEVVNINSPLTFNVPSQASPGQAWIVTVLGLPSGVNHELLINAYCFDNPPGHTP